MNFKLEDEKTTNVHYDRLNNLKKREKPFTPKPPVNRKTIVREQNKIDQNRSDVDDIIEIESSTDNENLIKENQSEAEGANDSNNTSVNEV